MLSITCGDAEIPASPYLEAFSKSSKMQSNRNNWSILHTTQYTVA